MKINEFAKFGVCLNLFGTTSAVTVTAVTVTIAYCDSFGNPQLTFHVEKISIRTTNIASCNLEIYHTLNLTSNLAGP